LHFEDSGKDPVASGFCGSEVGSVTRASNKKQIEADNYLKLIEYAVVLQRENS